MPKNDIPTPSLNGLFPTFKLWWDAYLINKGLKKSYWAIRQAAMERLARLGPRGSDVVRVMLRFDRAGSLGIRLFYTLMFAEGVDALWSHYHFGRNMRDIDF